MILKKLILKNFKSHTDTVLDFNKGITIIVGENGVGKSSILEGITYALFKKSTLNQNDLITLGKNNERKSTMSVTLVFEENGNEYKIVRTNSITSSTSTLQKKINGKFKVMVVGNSEVNKELNSIINMDNDLFLNAIYIRQGEIADLVSKKPSERKKLIGKFLNIEDLEKAWEKMPKVINDFEKEKERLNGMYISKSDTDSELNGRKIELENLRNELSSYLKIKENNDDALEKVLKVKESMEQEKTKYIVLLNSITNEKFNLQKMKNNKNDLVKELEEILNNEEEFKEIEKRIKDIDIDEYNDIIIELKSDIKSLESINSSLDTSLNEIYDIENRCPICQSEIDDEKKEQLISYYEDLIDENLKKIENDENEIKKYNLKIKEFNDYNSRYIELKMLIKNKFNIKKKISNLESDIEISENEISSKQNDLKKINYDKNKYERVLSDERKINIEITGNLENIGITKGKISNTENQIEKLINDLKNIKKIENKINNLNNYIDLLNDFRFLYSRDGIQNDLRNISKNIIQENTNKYFEKFNFDYSSLYINDDFEVSLFRDDNEISMNMISGGERIAIAVALRLGITKTIAQGNIDCIFLDEPTIHLDDVRIEELNNLLLNMNIIPQMIIVTHNQKLENLADTLIKVEKDDGVSKVII